MKHSSPFFGSAMALLLALAVTAADAQPVHGRKSSDGLVFEYGIVAASAVPAHPGESERAMHRGVSR
jgi:hypothetical protein